MITYNNNNSSELFSGILTRETKTLYFIKSDNSNIKINKTTGRAWIIKENYYFETATAFNLKKTIN